MEGPATHAKSAISCAPEPSFRVWQDAHAASVRCARSAPRAFSPDANAGRSWCCLADRRVVCDSRQGDRDPVLIVGSISAQADASTCGRNATPHNSPLRIVVLRSGLLWVDFSPTFRMLRSHQHFARGRAIFLTETTPSRDACSSSYGGDQGQARVACRSVGGCERRVHAAACTTGAVVRC